MRVLGLVLVLGITGAVGLFMIISECGRMRAEQKDDPLVEVDATLHLGVERDGDAMARLVNYQVVCAEGFQYVFVEWYLPFGGHRAIALAPVFDEGDRLPKRCPLVGRTAEEGN